MNVWSYEVAEHIHPKYTDAFLYKLTSHGPVVVLSAAQPGQGGCDYFNEQPLHYRMSGSNVVAILTSTIFLRSSSPCPTNMLGT
jgi:hypothetical protein